MAARVRQRGDERALVRLCFNAPREAAERGTRAVVMLDDVHLADRLEGATSLGAEVAQAATDSTTRTPGRRSVACWSGITI